MRHFYEEVPGLGNVAVSRHAQDRAAQLQIPEHQFRDILLTGADTPDGMSETWREKGSIRLVILLRPEPYTGAVLVKTVFRVKPSHQAYNR